MHMVNTRFPHQHLDFHHSAVVYQSPVCEAYQFFLCACDLGLTPHNIYYITPITHHWHANILPSTGQENNNSTKNREVILLLISFFIIFNHLIAV